EPKDLVQVGASSDAREVLAALQEHGHIEDLMDGYRLAIAVAIAFGREPNVTRGRDRTTMFAVGNLDPDTSLREAIKEIYPYARATPARAAEDLAEQGLDILEESFDGESLSFTRLIRRVRKVYASEDESDE